MEWKQIVSDVINVENFIRPHRLKCGQFKALFDEIWRAQSETDEFKVH